MKRYLAALQRRFFTSDNPANTQTRNDKFKLGVLGAPFSKGQVKVFYFSEVMHICWNILP